MKILHLCVTEIGGSGAGVIRLHRALLAAGQESRALFLHRQLDEPQTYAYQDDFRWPQLLARKVRQYLINRQFWAYRRTLDSQLEMYSDDRTPRDVSRHPLVQWADVIHVHWIGGFVDSGFAAKVAPKPVVYTMADMSHFTGGCYYNRGCDRFRSRCGSCPQLGSAAESDLTRQVWLRKRRTYDRANIRFVALTNWLAEEARGSGLLAGHRVEVIPFGMPEGEFRPMDRAMCRSILGLPQDKKVILFGAVSVANPRKGFECLKGALNTIAGSAIGGEVVLATFGAVSSFADGSGMAHYPFGSVRDARLLAMCYNAADVYVMPSLQEAFGYTALEAMACGLPTVAFRGTGTADIVVHGETGYLAEHGSEADLAQGILSVLSQAGSGVMKDRSVSRARSEFSGPLWAERHRKLYQSALDGPAPCA